MTVFRFKNGDELPAVGLGTWKSATDEVGNAVKEAIKVGYRHIDCAPAYGNEKEIGQAFAECFEQGLVKRSDLVIASKLWNDSHEPEHVLPALEQTLKDLRLEYLDIYLMHWPVALPKGTVFPTGPEDMVPLADCPISSTWKQMEAAVKKGLVRHIGVSNFSVKKVKELLADSEIQPEVNQIERHPYLQRKDLLSFCHANQILVTGYSALGSVDRPAMLKGVDEPVLLQDPEILKLAEQHNATPAQVLLKWNIQNGVNVIPKSTRTERLKQNLAAASALELSKQDMAKIASMDQNRKYLDGSFWCMEGSPYTLENLWDE